MKEGWRSGLANTFHTARAEPSEPYCADFRCGVELARGSGFAKSHFQTPHHRLSTFRRKGCILAAVLGLSVEH